MGQDKYLDVYIDKLLSLDYHIQNNILSQVNGILSKLRYNVPIEVLLQVYHATFSSYLSYGCAVCGVTSEKNILKIETIQKKSLKILTFSDLHSHTVMRRINALPCINASLE